MWEIPRKFNRNSGAVRQMGAAADTGMWLIQYMCDRVGVPDLEGMDVLDFGCGSRFADAIVNRDAPLNSYVGIDVYGEMIDYLAATCPDPRLSFVQVDAHNDGYNRDGARLTRTGTLPLGDRKFDLICMFSVITHQVPHDAGAIFSILRRYVRPDGRLFFSARVDPGDFFYRDMNPNDPTGLSIFSPLLMEQLLAVTGWKIVSKARRRPQGVPIQESYVCEPAPRGAVAWSPSKQGDTNFHAQMCRLLLDLGYLDAAAAEVRFLRETTEPYPKLQDLTLAVVEKCATHGKPLLSRALLIETIEAIGSKAPLLEALVRLYRRIGYYPEAEASARDFMKHFPKSPQGHVLLGEILRTTRKTEESVTVLSRGLQLAPDNVSMLMQLGVSLVKAEKREEAKALFERLLTLAPNDRAAQLWLVRLTEKSLANAERSAA